MKKLGNKGITLIALVITIIVLLILAGITINLVVGDNGIITKGKQAKYHSELAAYVEKVKLPLLDEETKCILENTKLTLDRGYTRLEQVKQEGWIGNLNKVVDQEKIIVTTTDGYVIEVIIKVTGEIIIEPGKEGEEEIIPGGESIQLIPDKTTWTNDNVNVTITWPEKIEKYTKQIKITKGEEITQDWTEYTDSIVIMSENGKLEARLVNQNNNLAGEVSSLDITIIDKVAPTIGMVTKIKSSTSVGIQASNIVEIESGIAGYQYKLANWGEIEANSSKSFTGLSPNTENMVWVKAIDIAGNESIEYGPYKITTNGAYNAPYMPDGFSYVTGTWENGYVVKDVAGNEFVWIPVPDTSEFKNKTDNFNISTTANGGFYLARYEAGVSETSGNAVGVPVSKKGVIPWNSIDAIHARDSAAKMYETKLVKSQLSTETAWLRAAEFIAEEKGNNAVYVDSAAWGNFAIRGTLNGTLRNCGYSETWKAKNLYDFAGNLFEFNLSENFDTFSTVPINSGSFSSNPDDYACVSGASASKTKADNRYGFRVSIYRPIDWED